MKQISKKKHMPGTAVRLVLLCAVLILSLLPKIISAFSNGDGILSVLGILGMSLLRWLILCVIIILLTGACTLIYKWFFMHHFRNEEIEKDANEYAMEIGIVTSYIILVIYQAVTSWQIAPGTFESVLRFIFP